MDASVESSKTGVEIKTAGPSEREVRREELDAAGMTECVKRTTLLCR
jgi:hypothetical protein